MSPEGLIPTTETDPWECWERIFHYRYRYPLHSNSLPLQMQTLGSKLVSSVIVLATTVLGHCEDTF